MFGISVDEIRRLNNLKSDVLQIGQTLKLSNNGVPSGNTSTYIVQRNDTLYGIASKYGITVNELKRLNNLASNTLYIGQEILVPNNSDSDNSNDLIDDYDTYIVKKGDSLWLIANNYGITVDELVKINNLDSLTLQIGQQLKVPATKNSDYDSDNMIHVVQKGDTLWSIAREYDLSVDELKQINNLTSNLLTLGQELIIKK